MLIAFAIRNSEDISPVLIHRILYQSPWHDWKTTKMLGLTGCIRAEGSVFISWKMSTYLVLFRQIILAHMHQPIRCLFQNCKKNWMILLIMTNMYMEMAGTGFPVQDFYTISRNVQLPVSRS